MSDTLLEKYTGRRLDEPPLQARLDRSEDSDAFDNFGAFGWLRGVRERSVMIELRKKTGDILAVGYGWIDRIQFDPSDGISLQVSGQRILIRGQNLNAELRPHVRLFEGMTRHRVPWLAEQEPLGPAKRQRARPLSSESSGRQGCLRRFSRKRQRNRPRARMHAGDSHS